MTTSTPDAAAAAKGVPSNNNNNNGLQINTAPSATTRVMQSDEDFNIRFVNLVRMHKCLYDKKVPEYRNRDNQEKAWSLISQETRESVIHCKERWRNLRACLSRYIKQQSGSDPQHKPYYLTEHMAFLLPFLKSTRNSLDSSSLIALFHGHQQHNSASVQLLGQAQFNGDQLDMKTSLSDNDDEETIDAFDPVVAATLSQHKHRVGSPLSDTVSASTLQNFIPDVQLAELRCDGSGADITFINGVQHNISSNHQCQHGVGPQQPGRSDVLHEPKRIKTEPQDGSAAAHQRTFQHVHSAENADMEFFRSIMPDIEALTPQQKRKFKIGILELIDDVIERYPAEGRNGASRPTRRNSAREWRK